MYLFSAIIQWYSTHGMNLSVGWTGISNSEQSQPHPPPALIGFSCYFSFSKYSRNSLNTKSEACKPRMSKNLEWLHPISLSFSQLPQPPSQFDYYSLLCISKKLPLFHNKIQMESSFWFYFPFSPSPPSFMLGSLEFSLIPFFKST